MSGALAEDHAALRRVAVIAAAGEPPEVVFEAVAVEASALLGGALVVLARFEGEGAESVVVAQSGDHVSVGARLRVTGDSIAARMWSSGRAERIDDYTGVAGTAMVEQLGLRAAVAVPVTVDGRLWGSLGVSSRTAPLPAGTEDRMVVLAEIVAAAVATAAARDAVRVLAAEQAALLRVAALVARGAGEAEIFDAVAVEAAGLIHDEATTLVRHEGDRTFTVLAHRNGPAPVGMRFTVPQGDAGTLDAMMRTLRPARLDRYDRIADRSYSNRDFGVGSSVSVPIVVNGRLWGALGALNEGHGLPEETEGRLAKFAELVSLALAGVAARAELRRFGDQQAALRRVAELVARGAALGEVLDAVATEASNILGGAASNLFRYDGELTTAVATCRSPVPVGLQVPAGGDTVAGLMARDPRPMRFSALGDTASAVVARDFDVQAMVAVPVVVEGRLWGGLSTTTPTGEQPPADAEVRLAEFAELANAAIANAENRAKLRASRARVVATADETRRRLQRDVHDGAQQRLVQTVLTLKLGLDAAARGEETVDLMREALEHAERATVELRDIVHGILPAALARGGLRAGLDSLVAALAIPVDVDATALPADRLPREVEVTAYFVVAEALTNVVKHSGATRAQVTVAAAAGSLVVEVRDDGAGGADPRGSGLTGLSDRVDALDGTMALTSRSGTGTLVRVTLPLSCARPG